jgi:hypothetical protein
MDCGTRGGLMENIPISPVSVVVFSMPSNALGRVAGDRFSSAPRAVSPLTVGSIALPARGRIVKLSLMLLSRLAGRLRGGVSIVNTTARSQRDLTRCKNYVADRWPSRIGVATDLGIRPRLATEGNGYPDSRRWRLTRIRIGRGSFGGLFCSRLAKPCERGSNNTSVMPPSIFNDKFTTTAQSKKTNK